MIARASYTADDIKGWLSTTGSPFEMRVAARLLAKGARVEQGHYYIDPDNAAKSREIDVIAYRGLAFDTNARLDITAVIECKYAPTPWVLYRRNSMGEVQFLDRVAPGYGAAWLKRVMGIAGITGQRLLRREDRPGYRARDV